jgi:hypothetical protein
MIKQSIIHRMLLQEIEAFAKAGLNPNTVVMSANILHHMLQWEDIDKYYIPAERTEDLRARYRGLLFVEATPKYSEDLTRTPGECFVCCAASSGKLKDIFL